MPEEDSTASCKLCLKPISRSISQPLSREQAVLSEGDGFLWRVW